MRTEFLTVDIDGFGDLHAVLLRDSAHRMTAARRSEDVVDDLRLHLPPRIRAQLPLEVTEAVEPVEIHRGLEDGAPPLGDGLDVHADRRVRELAQVLVEHLREVKGIVLNEDVLLHGFGYWLGPLATMPAGLGK